MRTQPKHRRSVWLARPEVIMSARIALIPVVIFVLTVALWREGGLPNELEGGIAKHTAAFFVISTLYLISWPGSVASSVSVLSASGFALELLQIPFGREFGILDLFANLVGILLGCLVVIALSNGSPKQARPPS